MTGKSGKHWRGGALDAVVEPNAPVVCCRTCVRVESASCAAQRETPFREKEVQETVQGVES